MPFSADNIRHPEWKLCSLYLEIPKNIISHSQDKPLSHCRKKVGTFVREPLFLKGLLSRWETAARPGSRPSGTGLKKQAPTLTAESRNVPVSNASVSGRLRVRFVLVAASHSGEGHFIKDRTNNHSRCGKLTRKGFVVDCVRVFQPPPLHPDGIK